MLNVAITGGIGAGKSEALRAFEKHGAATISSDEIVHALLRGDEAIIEALRARWGSRVFDDIGQVYRPAIADIVFSDPAELAWLEGLLHPRVEEAYLTWRDELARQPRHPSVCVTEVPLLFESHAEALFDAIVVITAPAETRWRRTSVSNDGRESRLISDDEKIARADFAYVNDGGRKDLDKWVTGVLQELRRRVGDTTPDPAAPGSCRAAGPEHEDEHEHGDGDGCGCCSSQSS